MISFLIWLYLDLCLSKMNIIFTMNYWQRLWSSKQIFNIYLQKMTNGHNNKKDAVCSDLK